MSKKYSPTNEKYEKSTVYSYWRIKYFLLRESMLFFSIFNSTFFIRSWCPFLSSFHMWYLKVFQWFFRLHFVLQREYGPPWLVSNLSCGAQTHKWVCIMYQGDFSANFWAKLSNSCDLTLLRLSWLTSEAVWIDTSMRICREKSICESEAGWMERPSTSVAVV